MAGILTALLSGALMSIQGVFNTEVTKQTSTWLAAGWVQISAFAVCLAAWCITGREPIGDLFRVKPWYLLLGGAIGAFITITVIWSMAGLGPAKAAMLSTVWTKSGASGSALWLTTTVVGIFVQLALASYVLFVLGPLGVPEAWFGVFMLSGAVGAIIGSLSTASLKRSLIGGPGLRLPLPQLPFEDLQGRQAGAEFRRALFHLGFELDVGAFQLLLQAGVLEGHRQLVRHVQGDLRIAEDRCERGFQLMGYVRRKFASHLLGRNAVGDV